MTPNFFAYIALLGWPIIVVVLFKRYPVNKAIILTILWGYLLLPVGLSVDFPLIPPFNKETLPVLVAFFIIRFQLGRRVKLFAQFDSIGVIMSIYLISPTITVLSNQVSLNTGGKVISGLSLHDGISVLISQWILLLPFLLGRQFLNKTSDLEMILRFIVIAGLVYSVLILFEIRMSPQLHRWVYGYHNVGFAQQKRGGGFRSTVFLGHGLWVAYFVMMATVVAAIFWKLKYRVINSIPAMHITIYLFVVLLLSKSLGSLIYAIAFIPLILWGSVAMNARIVKVLVVICILYPLLRLYDYFPLATILDWAYAYDVNRGQSLQYRFDQEGALLAHANQHFLFGWGGWGRNRIYDALGNDISITDGHWIITLGVYGLVGFLAEFSLLLLPVYKTVSWIKNIHNPKDKLTLMCFSIILIIYVVDLLPNDPMSPLTWLIAGALYGNYETQREVYKSRAGKK